MSDPNTSLEYQMGKHRWAKTINLDGVLHHEDELEGMSLHEIDLLRLKINEALESVKGQLKYKEDPDPDWLKRVEGFKRLLGVWNLKVAYHTRIKKKESRKIGDYFIDCAKTFLDKAEFDYIFQQAMLAKESVES